MCDRRRLQLAGKQRPSTADGNRFQPGWFEVFKDQVFVIVLGFHREDDFNPVATDELVAFLESQLLSHQPFQQGWTAGQPVVLTADKDLVADG